MHRYRNVELNRYISRMFAGKDTGLSKQRLI